MMPKFKVGDKVIADGDCAVVTQLLDPADSDFNKTISYAVEWSTNEWGTFEEDELVEVEEQTASQKMAAAGYTRRPKSWTKEDEE